MKYPQIQSTQRFSYRVENYVRYRPGYPDAVTDVLKKKGGLTTGSVIADIGSGTGISAELFLRNGNVVYAVEPNAPMRRAAESLLQGFSGFHSIGGTAEDTTLADNSIDFVVAAQAFHWFNTDEAKREFARILRPGGQVVLMWNARRSGSTEFLRAYETFLEKFGTDYMQVNHRNIHENTVRAFFQTCRKEELYNEQLLDFEGLKGRLLSSSYSPAPDNPQFGPMMDELKRMFDKYHDGGFVRIEYDTEVYFGPIAV